MKKRFIYILFFIGLVAYCNATVVPAVLRLDSLIVNRLIPSQGKLTNGIKQLYPEEPYKTFWIENWNRSDQMISWVINSDAADYLATVIVCVNGLEEGEKVNLVLSNDKDSIFCQIKTTGWQRCQFSHSLHFDTGFSNLFLRIEELKKHENLDVCLYALEVATFNTYERLQAKAKSLRSNTSWMADLPYGFFFHWNSKSMPLAGEQLTYEEAVNDFDVDRFAQVVHECGGKLVFFTTTWAEYYFPAPIHTIDSILPGRTTKRDLIADLSDALSKYDIRLILYYHIGHGDKEWWNKQNYTRGNAENLFTNVEKIIEEICLRYGSRLSGLWMDDGIGYYPNGASFEKITEAAKKGNRDLVICFNSWILPKLTDFQDYYAGELGLSLTSAGVDNPNLQIDGDGIFHGGPQDGLQATYSGTLEPGDWTHIYKNRAIDDPILSLKELVKIVQESNRRKNLPMINVRIYQDGTISPQSYTLLKSLNNIISKAEK